jgi:FG-GAP-like repeat
MKTRSVSRNAFSNLHALAGLVVFAAFGVSCLPDAAMGQLTFNNAITNGGFETGSLSPWVIANANPAPVVSTVQYHSGTHSALLGTVSGSEPFGNSSFYQQIYVPAAGGTLSYWWLGGTRDRLPRDFQDVYVTNTSGTILATIQHTCAGTAGWVHKTFNMTPYAGQTVRIKFLVHQDGAGDNTWMYVDDISLHSPNANYVLYNSSTRATAVWRLNNNVFTSKAGGPTLPAGWSLVDAADFDGNGRPDYLLFNASTGQSAIWYLAGTTFVDSASGPTVPSGWVVVTTADFNRDGRPDYVLYNASTGQTAIWYMNNNIVVNAAFGPELPTDWRLVDAADFNGNGHPDYLLFRPSTAQTAIWYLSGTSGTTFVSSAFGPTIPGGWVLLATADFNGEGHPDYVLYESATRKTAIWYLNSNRFVGSAYAPTLPAGWSVVDALPSVP